MPVRRSAVPEVAVVTAAAATSELEVLIVGPTAALVFLAPRTADAVHLADSLQSDLPENGRWFSEAEDKLSADPDQLGTGVRLDCPDSSN